MSASVVTLEGIRAAQARLSGHVENTPCLHSRTLSEITDPVEVDLLSGACHRKSEGGETPGEFAMSLRRSVLGTRNATSDARSGRPERAA